MNPRTPLTLLFAVCCVFAGVSMAASLESSVSGKPDDIVNVDVASLPIPTEQADQITEALDTDNDERGQGGTRTVRSEDGDEQSAGDDGSGSDEPSAGGSSSVGTGGSDGDQEGPGSIGSSGGEAADGGQSGQSSAGQESADSGGSGESPAPPSLLDRILEMLQMLLMALIALALLGLLAAAIYKRDELLARFRSQPDEDADEMGSAPLPREPENPVERQWLELLDKTEGVDDPAMTPRERAEKLIEAGKRREAVHSLRELVEAARYDDTSVTADTVSEAAGYLDHAGGDDDD